MSIAEFLLARIAEDEAAAREVQEKVAPREKLIGPPQSLYSEDVTGSELGVMFDVDYSEGGVTISAGRVLAECAAKRAIVEQYDIIERLQGNFDYDTRGAFETIELTVHYLAAVYADHPDYEEEWRL